MLSAVEPELAFLSTLCPAGGKVKAVPSPKGLAGVPNVTASTRVPVFTTPSLKATLLLLEMVSAVFLLQARVPFKAVLHQRKNP